MKIYFCRRRLESNRFQSFQTFKTLQSFKNRTVMTGELRVQINRDELSRGNPDDRPARGRAYPERILGSAVSSRRSSSSSAD